MRLDQAIAIIRDAIHRDHPSQDTATLPAYVQAYLGVAASQVVGQMVIKAAMSGVRYDIPGGMLKPYIVAVGLDEERRAYYSEIPVAVSAMYGDAAVQGIHPRGNEAGEFVIMKQGQESRSPSFSFYGVPDGGRSAGEYITPISRAW